MSLKRARSPTLVSSPPSSSSSSPSHTRSTTIKDRGSTFLALFSASTSSLTARTLQSLPAYTTATHRIAAWRLPSTQRALTPGRTVYNTGHDDDGEAYAGRKLENLLKTLGVVGSVVVVRWYGGVMLGPVRFEHIERCAKEAIGMAGEGGEGVSGKRRRVDGEVEDVDQKDSEEVKERRREGVGRMLGQRDESIGALRGLLAEKQGRNQQQAETGRAKMNYAKMKVEVLEKLERARDTTIGWLLKELDKVDANAESDKKEAASGERDEVSGYPAMKMQSEKELNETEHDEDGEDHQTKAGSSNKAQEDTTEKGVSSPTRQDEVNAMAEFPIKTPQTRDAPT